MRIYQNGLLQLELEENGRIVSHTPNYETLVSTDQTIVNKKYHDDNDATGGSSVNWVKEQFLADTAIVTAGQVNLLNNPTANSEIISVNGVVMRPGITEDYNVSAPGDIISFNFTLNINDTIMVQYTI